MTDKKVEITPNRLILFTFFIVIANLILAVILIAPLLTPPSSINPQLQTVMVMAFFFIYYFLFLMYATHYINIFKERYRGNEHKYLIVGTLIGLVGLAAFSFWKLKSAPTLQWLIPTIAVILVPVIGYYWQKNAVKTPPS